ncbi:OmpH family outer membrane protein [Tabrizicola sp.]|uniref:OmpH family outer membrane protein n=1 Tax=Tabrizicola sp. TaxID=2005166 RepID=UPI002FDD5A95
MMAWWRNLARPGPRLRLAAVALMLAGPVQAQDGVAPLLTLDQDRFFLQSDFGKATIERERAASVVLEQENKRIEAELVAEEQALTEERKTLPPKEFAAKAEAFDQKVERIRAEQDAKVRELTDTRDEDRKAFLKAAVPVLGDLLGQKKATAILDKNLVILSLSAIDVTDEAIEMVNAALAEKPVPAP